jgi:cytochrome b6
VADTPEVPPATGPRGFARRVFDSFWRVGWPRDERAALRALLQSLVLHVHAPKVRPSALTFRATWGLGFVSLILLGALTATGVYLMFYYSPHPSAAYRSMKDIDFVLPFGLLTRNVHRWAAHAMVFLVTLHMVRVFLSGGYKAPREANWVVGVLAWVSTLALSFTGYLLPWDQLAFWAVTVGANMVAAVPGVGPDLRVLLLGDAAVGEPALLRFYVLHCVVLPLVILGLVSFHVFRVRKDGGPGHDGARARAARRHPPAHGARLAAPALPRGRAHAGHRRRASGRVPLGRRAAGARGRSGAHAQPGEGALVLPGRAGAGALLGVLGWRLRSRRAGARSVRAAVFRPRYGRARAVLPPGALAGLHAFLRDDGLPGGRDADRGRCSAGPAGPSAGIGHERDAHPDTLLARRDVCGLGRGVGDPARRGDGARVGPPAADRAAHRPRAGGRRPV